MQARSIHVHVVETPLRVRTDEAICRIQIRHSSRPQLSPFQSAKTRRGSMPSAGISRSSFPVRMDRSRSPSLSLRVSSPDPHDLMEPSRKLSLLRTHVAEDGNRYCTGGSWLAFSGGLRATPVKGQPQSRPASRVLSFPRHAPMPGRKPASLRRSYGWMIESHNVETSPPLVYLPYRLHYLHERKCLSLEQGQTDRSGENCAVLVVVGTVDTFRAASLSGS